MPTSPYQQAILKSRRESYALSRKAITDVQRHVDAWARELQRLVRTAPDAATKARLQGTLVQVRTSAKSLESAIASTVESGVKVTYSTVLDAWQGAMQALMAREGAGALIGASLPHIDTAAEYLAREHGYKTLVKTYARAASREVEQIISEALLRGTSQDVLARRLYAYVAGAEDYGKAFRDMKARGAEPVTLDLKAVAKDDRGAARQIEYNARRIATSEIANARTEAELRHFAADPLIYAVRRTLSPNRHSQKQPDVCDALARVDAYNMGRGVYPLRAVPPLAHPFDLCENIPLDRPVKEWGQKKPDPRPAADLKRRCAEAMPRGKQSRRASSRAIDLAYSLIRDAYDARRR